LTGPAYDFVAGAERLILAAYFNRNLVYSFHHDVELNRKAKGGRLEIPGTGKN